MSRRVLVTGLGAVTPLGVGADVLFERWAAGESGIVDGMGRCTDFEPAQLLSKKDLRRTDRFTQLGIAAGDEAIAQATGDGTRPLPDLDSVGCIIGTGAGGMMTIDDERDRTSPNGDGTAAKRHSPLAVPKMMGNAAAGFLAMRHGFRGPAFAVVSACAAGTDAIGVALRLVRSGEMDIAVTGGAESSLSPFSIRSFAAMEATSRCGVSRPFDARRDGFILAEGAGVLVLESEESALARGAPVLGELRGQGSSADAYHLVAPDPTGAGAALAIRRALADAGVEADELSYVNAHGTSTPLNDRAETTALKLALGPVADRIPVSSTKSAIGHLLGAAGAVEAIATLQSLRARTAAPTLNYEQAEEGLDLDYVPGSARPFANQNGRPAIGLSNSFGFGGHNSVLCLAGPS
jgi:3-oxoacyl-[acyl-carrier-protein] synthase II